MESDSSQLTLRLAESGDAAAMSEVIRAAFAARPPVDPPAEALSETADTVLAALNEGGGIVAEIDEEIIGCLLLRDPVNGACWMHRVSVHPQARKAGIAAAMVRNAAEVALDMGATHIELLTRAEFPETLQWWMRNGFSRNRPHPLGDVMSAELPVRIDISTGDEMQTLGRALAGIFKPGDVVLASGELGAGKTTLAQGIGAGLDVEGPIISPTFVLSRVHRARGDRPGLVHVDAYRLGSAAELDDLDLDATLSSSVTLLEWGNGLAEQLSDSRLEIDIVRSDNPEDEARRVYLYGIGPRWTGITLRDELADWKATP